MIPKPLHAVNDGLAFLLELMALSALCAWGFHIGQNLGVHVLLGLSAPLSMAVVWGAFCAPKARVKLAKGPLLALRTVILLIAGGALYASGWHLIALIVAGTVIVNVIIAALEGGSRANSQ